MSLKFPFSFILKAERGSASEGTKDGDTNRNPNEKKSGLKNDIDFTKRKTWKHYSVVANYSRILNNVFNIVSAVQ